MFGWGSFSLPIPPRRAPTPALTYMPVGLSAIMFRSDIVKSYLVGTFPCIPIKDVLVARASIAIHPTSERDGLRTTHTDEWFGSTSRMGTSGLLELGNAYM